MKSIEERIESLVRAIYDKIGEGGGGGLVEPGIPGNIPKINEDGTTLVDGLISVAELNALIDLVGEWDQETVDLVKNASKLSYYINILIGADEIPVFSASTPYSIGDICIKDNVLYRFTVAHSGSWSDADVVTTNFYKEFVRYYSGQSDNETVNIQLNFDSTIPSFDGKYVTVSYGGHTTDIELDETGSATITLPKKTQYTLMFPSFDGYNPVSNKNFTAYLEQRSVEVTYYHQGSVATDEVVTVKTAYTNTSSSHPSGSISVNDVTASETQTYNLDSSGQCQFSIAIGHSYTITFPSNSGYITPSNKSFTAALARRTVESKYAPLVSGMFLMDANLNQYTYDEWVASGKSGADAKYLFCSDATLSAHGANFFFCLDDIRTTSSIPSKQWLSAQVQVTTIPLCGNKTAAMADFGVVPYDPTIPGSGPISNMIALKSWIDDKAQEGSTYTSALYSYAITKDLTINGVTYPAYIGTAGQWEYLSTEQNYGTFQRIMQKLHETDSTMPADPNWVNKTFWTMTQYSSAYSWSLPNGSLNSSYGKTSSGLALCFYAL